MSASPEDLWPRTERNTQGTGSTETLPHTFQTQNCCLLNQTKPGQTVVTANLERNVENAGGRIRVELGWATLLKRE